MVCPNCGSRESSVYDSIPDDDDYVFRRRKCKNCRVTFHTAESVISYGSPLEYTFSDAERKKKRRVKNERL